jgi:hypothetical protein
MGYGRFAKPQLAIRPPVLSALARPTEEEHRNCGQEYDRGHAKPSISFSRLRSSAARCALVGGLPIFLISRGACMMYVMGSMDGAIAVQARAKIPFRHCTKGASYWEVGEAYLTYLAAEQN